MTNIKFRAFINGKYLTPFNDEVAITQNGRILLFDGYYWGSSYNDTKNVKIEFWTGFRDKLDAEIYDGDIVRTGSGKIARITKINGCYVLLHDNGETSHLYPMDVEVIGNINEKISEQS